MSIFDLWVNLIPALKRNPAGKIWCLSLQAGLREAQGAGIKFTHRSKIQGFRYAGATRCTDSREALHGRRARGSTWLCKISPKSVQGWESGPQNIKNFHFLVKDRPRGQTHWPISKRLRGFYAHHYPAKFFKFDVIRFTGYGVTAEKPRVGHLGRIFPCTL